MRVKLKAIVAGLLVSATMVSPALAGVDNDVPSCYAATHIVPPTTPYDGMVYVLIDQTVLLDQTLQQSVLENAMRLIGPGVRFAVAEFSAFSQGHYLQVLHTGVIEKPLEAERVENTPIAAAKNLAQCLDKQKAFARQLAASSIVESLKSSTSSLDKSDVMLALKTVSSAIEADHAAKKVVFVVTDGLENSSISSFYSHNAVRKIDPKAELAKAKEAQVIGNFGGARVYILGGGMMAPAETGSKAQKNGYRDPDVLRNLSDFWRAYFLESHADLAEFGEPALISPVSFQ